MITVYDLILNEANNELVAGTFARSIMTFPIDSILTMEEEDTTTTSHNELILQKPNRILAYPNPASDFINLEIQNIEPNRPLEVVILNSKGQILYNSGKQTGEIFKTQISVTDWPSGAYIVKSKNRHQVSTKQFIKIE